MIEKVKTVLLVFLVLLSLLQSYLLAYSMPGLGATVIPQQDYVKAEPMGAEEKVENLVFPEDMVLHFGGGKHTVLYPGMNFYNLIYDRVRGREFKGFQRGNVYKVEWDKVREQDTGVELRFGTGVPVELLGKVFKLDEGDVLFKKDIINRIWIYKNNDREEVRTYFFSADGRTVYESVRADLTVRDVQNYVGFGEYWTPYQAVNAELYLPLEPLQAVESVVGYDTYTPEQMQRNLFFDPNETKAINDRNGSQIYTDGKRVLQVEQNGQWISFTDPAAGQGAANDLSENVYASVQFINQHGGWDGLHRFIQPGVLRDGETIQFQQYYGSYPIVPEKPFQFGALKLRVQQGVVSEYERSLITLNSKTNFKNVRWLPGGKLLETTLANYVRRSEVVAVYPAVQASSVEDGKLRFEPFWAVRLMDGSQEKLLSAMRGKTKPEPGEAGGADPGRSSSAAAPSGKESDAGMQGIVFVPAGDLTADVRR